ncbi:MAG: nitrilase family protein [Bacteroidales bacterium]|nr:nitrilase family protein [Bacteroidales bacterium]MCM1148318.1 nitrilase family protein [Bacteroidales bacterium]MCM1206990.1 nitrilase family protein [Bacillota bacterium]MCM1511287.1 hypothetical protein [Clostridium sp.]
MKVTLVQMDIKWEDSAANREAAEQFILDAPRSDIYVLPEMWNTGFTIHPEGIAEEDGDSLEWMKRMSNTLNAAICGSIATKNNSFFYNRLYFVTPNSEVQHYDKRHLFTYGKENLSYTAGTERVIATWRGVRFLLQICYDLRFPCFSRNNNDYDAVIYVASWPQSRIHVWHTLLCARAIENQCYAIGVNRTGNDPLCKYNGSSEVYDAYGHCIISCGNSPSSQTFDIDMKSLNAFKDKFPVLHDQDYICFIKE